MKASKKRWVKPSKKQRKRIDEESVRQLAARNVQAYSTNELNRRIDNLVTLVGELDRRVDELFSLVVSDNSDKYRETWQPPR